MSNHQHHLYIIEHRASGRCYVGWTSQLPRTRWRNHVGYARANCKTYFHKALRKYGRGAFAWTVVHVFDSDLEARDAEIYWIARLKEFGVPLYNMTDGGDGIPGHRHTDETKAKMRAAKTEEIRERLRAINKARPTSVSGRRHSEETKARISAALTGKPKRGPSKRLGIPLSAETKEKIRQAAFARYQKG